MIIYITLTMNKEEDPVLRVTEVNDKKELSQKDILLTSGFGIYKANEILRAVAPGVDIKFDNFKQYDELIQEVNDLVVSKANEANEANEVYNTCMSV